MATENEFLDALKEDLKNNRFKVIAMKPAIYCGRQCPGYLKLTNLVLTLTVCIHDGKCYVIPKNNPYKTTRTIEYDNILEVYLADPKSIDQLRELFNDVRNSTELLTKKYGIQLNY